MHSPTIMMAQEILSNVLIILLIGTIGGRFAEAIRIPDVVIYILIGLLIGPLGLGTSYLHPLYSKEIKPNDERIGK